MDWLFGKVYEVQLLSRCGEIAHVRGKVARKKLAVEDLRLRNIQITQTRSLPAQQPAEKRKPRPSALQKLIDEGKADPISDRERELLQVLLERQQARREKRENAQPDEATQVEGRISEILEKNQVHLNFFQRLRVLLFN